jgi:hypothetical protein
MSAKRYKLQSLLNLLSHTLKSVEMAFTTRYDQFSFPVEQLK